MEQFSLEKYLKNPNRKVTTRFGNREVRIICTDRKAKLPIVALMVDMDGNEYVTYHTKNGWCSKEEKYPDKRDFFFADEENLNSIIDELKSYLEKTPKEQIEKDWKEIQDWYAQHFTNEKHNEKEELTEFEKRIYSLISFSDPDNFPPIKEVKKEAEIILDMAREEILKDLPKLEKTEMQLTQQSQLRTLLPHQ